MEQIIRSYGRFFVCGAALIAVFWLFVGREALPGTQWSVRKAVAAEFMPQESVAADTDFDAFNAEGACAPPQIRWKQAGALEAGSYAVSDLAEAWDYAGRALEVQVREITGEGADIAVRFEEDGRVLHFGERGIYTLLLSATDEGRRRSFLEVQVPVNGRET